MRRSSARREVYAGRSGREVNRSRNVSANWAIIALAVMFLATYRASSIHPDMAIRVFNPRMCIVHRIQDNVTVCRLFSHTLYPLFVLSAVRAIKFLFASRLMFVLQKLGANQAAALVRAAQPAEFRFCLV